MIEVEGNLISFCLLQAYEARLFRFNKGHGGGVISSADEAVDLRKKVSALNRFYWTLSQPDKAPPPSSNEDEGKKRDVGEKVMVSIHISTCMHIINHITYYFFV